MLPSGSPVLHNPIQGETNMIPSAKFFTLILIFLGSFITLFFCASVPLRAENAEVKLSDRDLKPIGALAWIEPKSRVLKIGAPNPLEGARVARLDVGEGDLVQKGQILGVFSTYDRNKSSYEAAEANLKLALATLEKVKTGNRKSDILSQKQTVVSLRVDEDAAKKEFLRLENLYQAQLSSKSQYDTAKANYGRLSAQRKAAEASLESLENVRPDDLAIAESQVSVARSEVDVAKANLDLSAIIAPIDGTIITIYARSSESVGDNGILDIADLNVMDAVAEVDENDILRVQKGQKAKISIPGLENEFDGVVREVGGQIKRNSVLDFNSSQILDTRVVEVRIELDRSQNGITGRLINKKARARIIP
ncbi:MAG: HlyD family efflux transporter periplasmic adaptor subunit [Alphaproteobacteria bacterium]|nr:HlyD family efflux transporter periplasmic adaptor subunit [Alphaproteobacteria bacterium]